MHRFAIALAWVSIATATVLGASPPVLYTSPRTELTYHYAVRTDPGGAELWRFVIPQKTGELTLTLATDQLAIKVDTELGRGSFRETMTYTAPVGSGVGELELAWPDERTAARFADHGEPGRVEPVAGSMPECEKLREGELPRARNDALELVRAEYLAHTEAPRHLEILLAALHFAAFAPLVAGDCEVEQDPSAGSCHHGYIGFNECLQCCEIEAGINAFLCQIAARGICTIPLCQGLGNLLCGGMAHLGSNYCAQHNCRGKLGDPGCNQDAPCEGVCMYFCGAGWSSGCGSCEGQGVSHQQCCR